MAVRYRGGRGLYCIQFERGLKGVLALLCLKGFEKSCPDSTLKVVTFLVLVLFKAQSPYLFFVAVKSGGADALWKQCQGSGVGLAVVQFPGTGISNSCVLVGG